MTFQLLPVNNVAETNTEDEHGKRTKETKTKREGEELNTKFEQMEGGSLYSFTQIEQVPLGPTTYRTDRAESGSN